MGWIGKIRKGFKQVAARNSLDMKDFEVEGIKAMTPRICETGWTVVLRKSEHRGSLINKVMSDTSSVQKFYKKKYNFYFPNFKLLSVMLNRNKSACLQRNGLLTDTQ